MLKKLSKPSNGKENGDCKKWPAKHASLRAKLQASGPTRERYSSCHDVRGFSNARTLDAIDVCYEATSSAQQEQHQCVILDTSQDLGRLPWGKGVIPTLTRSSDLYFYPQHRAIAGLEHLRVLGFHTDELDFSASPDTALRDLSGDSMAVPVVSLMAVALILVMQGHVKQ